MIYLQQRIKLCRYRFLAICLLWITASVSGQQIPKAELVGEFGLVSCGEVHSRTDNFAEAMKNDPSARAIILINPPTRRPAAADVRRRQISSFLQNRGLDTDRFSIYKGRTSADGEIRTQFWKAPPGTELPFADGSLFVDPNPDISRPFLFGGVDENGVCPTFVPRAFASLILANPGSRGNIVVDVGKGSTVNKYWFAGEQIKDLVESYGVPRNQLRLFFTKSSAGLTTAEFWFVPARKK